MTVYVGKNRRVLFIVENLPSPFDRRVWQEATTLCRANYSVSIICPKGKGYEKSYEVISGVHIYRHPLPLEASGALGYMLEYSAALMWQFFLTWKLFLTRGFDVIHACNPPDNIFLVAAIFKLFGVKFLFDHHDINPELYIAKFGRKDLLYRLLLFWERWTFKLADISIATNESYRQIALSRGGMDPQRVHVVRSGPDLGRVVRTEPVLHRKQGKRFLVGYVGVMGQQEGVNLLIDAANHIISHLRRLDIHFTLIGSGTELESIRLYAQKLGLSDHITFTGRIGDVELIEILNTADVCVNPDIANEMNDKSTMNKIMEYMALAKPIVQFDLTEGRVSAQNASLYALKNDPVDLANKIVWLLDHPQVRQSMGAFGRERVEKELAWDHEAPKLLQAYAQLFSL